MKYYKSPSGDVFAYEADGSQDDFIPQNFLPIGTEEADDLRRKPTYVPASITFAQLLIGLVAEQWITQADGEGWLTGTLPTAVTAVINGLPEGQRFAAKARALRPSEVLRADPLVAAMGLAAGKTEAEIDTFFRTYAQV